LSLFSGAGGGLLATKHLLGWTTVGYVEISDYAQRVLAQRIRDGYLDDAPIFTSIETFIDSGCVELYQKITDVITAGFPCQPFSVAGKQNIEDERNLWKPTFRCIEIVFPRFVFLENVPGLLSAKMVDETTNESLYYIGTIYRDLAEIGYDTRWDCISAAHCGANHKRLRWWLVGEVADTKYDG